MPAHNKSGTIRLKVHPNEKDTLTIQSNLDQLQSSFENQIFTPATSKVTDIGYYVYPVYFCYYFRVAFFLCLVPFWVEIKDQTNVKLVNYKIQRVLCAIVHVVSFLSLSFWFRFAANHSIKERPGKVFEMTEYLCYAMYVIAYAKVVWSGKIVDLLEEIPPRRTHKVKDTGNIFLLDFVYLV